jgi:predicted MFS family arabinose efflux permease
MQTPSIHGQAIQAPGSWVFLLLAAACGMIAANIYYAQPLIGPIADSLGLSVQFAGLVATVTQVGYGIGLLLIVPLGDLMENRRLVITTLGVTTLALVATASATHAFTFLAAGVLIGLGSVTVQLLVLYAVHLAPSALQGRIVGIVTGGLMLGIMFARPAASFITGMGSWRTVFMGSAVAMIILAAVLRIALPIRLPVQGLRYGSLLASMGPLIWHTPVLRRRAFYQSCLFGAFSLFWTTVPLLLVDNFQFSQTDIAVFALTGIASALAAPLAGHAADRGWDRSATCIAMLAVAACFVFGRLGSSASVIGLMGLVLGAIFLGFGVSVHAVLGQRSIFSLDPESRGRLNGLFMATYFTAGALGSILGTWAYTNGGWTLINWIGFGLSVLALISLCTERNHSTPR